MKVLIICDDEILYKYNPGQLKEMFGDIELILSCGDLGNKYLDYIFSSLDKPLVYVNGNHIYSPDHDISFCKNIDGGTMIKTNGIRIVGFDGSPFYSGQAHQYMEKDVFFMVMKSFLKAKFFKADLIISHAPVGGFHEGDDPIHKGFFSYRKAIEYFKPKYWIHGHVHLKNHHEIKESMYKDTKIINVFGYKVLDLEF